MQNNLTLGEFYNKKSMHTISLFVKTWNNVDISIVLLYFVTFHTDKEINHPELFICRTAKSDTRP